jgi:hypothetical protein
VSTYRRRPPDAGRVEGRLERAGVPATEDAHPADARRAQRRHDLRAVLQRRVAVAAEGDQVGGLDPVEHAREARGVRDVAAHDLGGGRERGPPRVAGERAHRVPRHEQPGHQGSAHRAARARHQDRHLGSSSSLC